MEKNIFLIYHLHVLHISFNNIVFDKFAVVDLIFFSFSVYMKLS